MLQQLQQEVVIDKVKSFTEIDLNKNDYLVIPRLMRSVTFNEAVAVGTMIGTKK